MEMPFATVGRKEMSFELAHKKKAFENTSKTRRKQDTKQSKTKEIQNGKYFDCDVGKALDASGFFEMARD